MRRHPKRGTPAALRPGAGGQRRPPSAAGAGAARGRGRAAGPSGSSAAGARAPASRPGCLGPALPAPSLEERGFREGTAIPTCFHAALTGGDPATRNVASSQPPVKPRLAPPPALARAGGRQRDLAAG